MRLHCLTYFLILSHFVFAQADTWRSDEGLSNDWISDIVQDDNGYLWIATQYGLNKFDGYEFETINYDPDNPKSLSANWVRNLVKSKTGDIFLNCLFGKIHRLNPFSGELTQLTSPRDRQTPKIVRKFFIDSSNDLWIGSPDGLFKVENGTDQIVFVQDLISNDIIQEDNGTILILAIGGIYSLKNNLLQKEHTFPKDLDIRQLFKDNSGSLWAITTTGLFLIERKDWSLKKIPLFDFNLPKIFNGTAIFEDRQDRIWVAGENGINLINSDTHQHEYISLSTLIKDDLNTVEILKIFEDQVGNIWIGTNKGLIMTSSLHTRFETPAFLEKTAKITGARALLVTDDLIWFGNQSGLFQFSREQPNNEVSKILMQSVYSILKASDGTLYIGSNEAIYVKKNDQNKFNDLLKGTTNKIGVTWDIVEDNKGFIWMASTNGLKRYDPREETFLYFTSKTNKTIQSLISQELVIDKDGNLWGATLTSGVYKLTNTYNLSTEESAVFKNYQHHSGDLNSLSSDIVQSMTSSPDGSMWVGTDGGLNRIYPDDSVSRYLKSHGLRDDKFMSLHVDEQSILWGSTIGHGVMALDLNSNDYVFFDKEDGLKSNNFLLNSGSLDKDGLLYLGTDSEVQVINTKRVIDTKPIPTHFTFSSINFLSSKDRKNLHC